MKKNLILIGAGLFIGLCLYLAGFLQGRTGRKPAPVVVQTDTLLRVDTLKRCDTIRVGGQTIIIHDSTHIGDLPWVAYANRDSFAVLSDGVKHYITFDLKRWIKGMNGGYEFHPEGKTFLILNAPTPKPFPIQYRVSMDVEFDLIRKTYAEQLNAGFSFFDKAEVYWFGGYDGRINTGFGFKWHLK